MYSLWWQTLTCLIRRASPSTCNRPTGPKPPNEALEGGRSLQLVPLGLQAPGGEMSWIQKSKKPSSGFAKSDRDGPVLLKLKERYGILIICCCVGRGYAGCPGRSTVMIFQRWGTASRLS